jgi:LysR family transcriptional regulator (chromosome initiation inhibitor)
MFDYRSIAALSAVIETRRFELAAKKLFITQSAVSQRIQSLENYYGKPVLIREQPYRPTELGKLLLGHYQRLLMLEADFQSELTGETSSIRIPIAISRDSLETWFKSVMAHLDKLMPMCLEITADDQEVTVEYLKKGLVAACASTTAKSIAGCSSTFLGFFDYICVASPAFVKKYFKSEDKIQKQLLEAPAIIFDNKDKLHAKYLKKYFGITDAISNYHVVPSVAGFRQFAIQGHAYGLIPKIDILKELNQKKLINLFPDKVWAMPIFWHQWSCESKQYEVFSDVVSEVARKMLRQKD